MITISCKIAQAEDDRGQDGISNHNFCHLSNGRDTKGCECYCHKKITMLLWERQERMSEWE